MPPVATRFDEASCEFAVTVPVAVIAPVVIEVGLVPISITVFELFSVNSRLSATLTASSPGTKSVLFGTEEAEVENLVMIVAIEVLPGS